MAVRTAAALRLMAVGVGVAVGDGVAVGVAADVAAGIAAAVAPAAAVPVLEIAVGVIVLTDRAAEAVGAATDAEAAVVRNGGWLVPEFPFAASATAVTPTAAASTPPLIRPDIRIRIPGKRDRPAVRIRLDG